ncbi:MAG: endonuclease III [Chloroflexi bacterium]|nr:endonuclease III [Chloroflexota bacterium]
MRRKSMTIHAALIGHYGQRRWRRRLDPLSELVFTIISQNTSDVNRDVAYARLRQRFPSWEAVRDAPLAQIAEALKPAGLSNIKAPRLKQVLQIITERRGSLDLDFLTEMDPGEAKTWLTSLKGVGPKTAACVLLFACGVPAFPVDTHVHRVTQRLGLIGAKTGAERAHAILESLVPPEAYYTFHLNLIAHGRAICRAPNPRCEVCFLHRWCDYWKNLQRRSRRTSRQVRTSSRERT